MSSGQRGIGARILVGLAVAFMLTGSAAALAAMGGQETPVRSPGEVIQSQLAAFNAGDVEAMVANVSENFIYWAVDSDYSERQLQGRAAFRRSMEEYFASVPGARAEIEQMIPAGEFVAARERAYWLQNGQEVSQASLAVYEVRDGLIVTVWYYPAIP